MNVLNNSRNLVLVLILVACMGCRKEVAAYPSADTGSSLPAFRNKGLSWIMDKYRNDNMHVLIASHRGNWGNAPENSLLSIQQCIDHGVEILELDVRLTSDEQLILMHDKTLGRTATGSGEIKYHTLAYIKQQFLIGRDGKVTDQRIPTLEEALLQAKGKVLVMLDKSEYLLPWIEKVLEKTGTAQQIIMLGFDNYDKTINTYGPLMDDIIYIPGVHHSNNKIGSYIADFEQSRYNPSGYAFWIKTETSAVLPFIATVEQTGDRLWMNTVAEDQCAGHTDKVSLTDPANGWGWAIDKGANIILTDQPKELIDYLQSINRRN